MNDVLKNTLLGQLTEIGKLITNYSSYMKQPTPALGALEESLKKLLEASMWTREAIEVLNHIEKESQNDKKGN